ncbi:MAG: DUF7331 family protein [Natrialbaceae archaeon]
MSDRTDVPREEPGTETRQRNDGLDATGAYETGGEVVLYDTEEPLAWIQADNAVELTEMV